jgi:tetratricopeptide (TPR) repeat protein
MTRLFVWVSLAVAIGGAYYNALENGFVFDDFLVVVDNPAVRTSHSLFALLGDPLLLGERPLRTLSYVIDYRLGGMQPWVFHVSNVLYHWITACFVFLVAFRLTNAAAAGTEVDAAEEKTVAWRWRPALFITLLWAMHPVQTDSVTYIAGRRDVLGGLCLFVGFWAYLRFRAANALAAVRHGWLLLAGLVYGLGILSKESVIVLPALCLAYEIHSDGVWASLRRRWAFYTLAAALGMGVLWYFAGERILEAMQQGAWLGGSVANNFATVARIWVRYLTVMVYPRTLLADYSYDAFPVSESVTDPAVLWAVVALGATAIGVWGLARWRSLCGYGGVWMLIAILPVSHLIPIKEIAAEHYLYVPLFGFCLIAGIVLDALCGKPISVLGQRASLRPIAGYTLVAVLVAGAATRTVVRNRDWTDEETFWSATILTAPRCVRAHYNLAGVYKQQKRSGDAAREFSTVLAISPQHVGAILGLGELAFEAGHYGQALSYAVKAQALAPLNPGALYLLAWSHLGLNNLDDAEKLFLHTLAYKPQLLGAYRGLEAVAKERGDSEAQARWAEKRRALEGNTQ